MSRYISLTDARSGSSLKHSFSCLCLYYEIFQIETSRANRLYHGNQSAPNFVTCGENHPQYTSRLRRQVRWNPGRGQSPPPSVLPPFSLLPSASALPPSGPGTRLPGGSEPAGAGVLGALRQSQTGAPPHPPSPGLCLVTGGKESFPFSLVRGPSPSRGHHVRLKAAPAPQNFPGSQSWACSPAGGFWGSLGLTE